MNKIWMPVVALTLIFASCTAETKVEDKKDDKKVEVKEEVKEDVVAEYSADATTSVIGFKGSKVGEDDFHTGTVKISEGTLSTTNGVVTAGTFKIDMTSITSDNEKLTNHLFQADLFNVEAFPQATFSITQATESEVKGTLSSLGAELPVTLAVTSTEADGALTFTGTGTVDYAGTSASSLQKPEEGDVYLNSVIELNITLVAKKK